MICFQRRGGTACRGLYLLSALYGQRTPNPNSTFAESYGIC
jgi:hypothetical protein